MANNYYNNDTNIIQDGTQASASDVENKADDIAAGFDGVEADIGGSIKLTGADNTVFEIPDLAATRAGTNIGFDSSGDLILNVQKGTYKGNWTTATYYQKDDTVKDTAGAAGSGVDAILVCLTTHTSTTLIADAANWDTFIDTATLESLEASATASAAAASVSETNAATSETNAATSESNANSSAILSEDSNLESGSWANEDEDVPVKSYTIGVPSDRIPTVYSAKHWATKSNTFATTTDRVFDTVADMVASTDLAVGDNVRTAGYTSANDGGGCYYRIVPSGTGTADGGSFINVTVHQAQADFQYTGVNVKQFGAVGNGVVEDAAAIQAAIDYMKANSIFIEYGGVGTLKFPAGVYKVSTTITVDANSLTLLGEAAGSSIIDSYTAANTFTVAKSNYATGVSGSRVRNVYFIDLVMSHKIADQTTGAHIQFKYAAECAVKGCSLINHAQGIQLSGVDEGVLIFDTLIQQGGDTTVFSANRFGVILDPLAVDATHPNAMEDLDNPGTYYVRSSSVHISDCEIKSTAYGMANVVEVQAVDGLYINNCHLAWSTESILHIKTTRNGMPLFNIKCSNVLFDTGAAGIGAGSDFTKRSVHYEGDVGITQSGVWSHSYVGCSFSGKGERAFRVNAGITSLSHVNITGCSFKLSHSEGLNMLSGSQFTIDNCQFDANCLTDTTKPQIRLSNVSDVVIANSNIYNGSATSGIVVDGASDDIILSNLTVKDASSTALDIRTTGKNLKIKDITTDKTGSVAAATTISIPAEFSFIDVTGPTNITTIDNSATISNSSWEGRVVTLFFTSTPTIVDSTGNLNLAGNLVGSSGDTLTLIYRSTNNLWYEVSRSVN